MSQASPYGRVCLDFPQNNGGEAGFASPHVNRESVTEEVVVRELLQNALDASLSEGPVRVDLRLERVGTQDLPLIKDYMAAFNNARNHRRDKVDSPSERQAIDRIRNCLQSEGRETDVFVCVDWGRGIDGSTLRALYNTGDTTKRSGRGSVGLGHLTAFAASDLRYVLYAGRDVAAQETFGGQAILATGFENGVQRDAHGYIRGAHEKRGTPASQATGANEVPDLVRSWLPPSGASGSVAAILGYQPTARASDRSLEESVLAAAAKSFVVAIHKGELTVTCHVHGQEKASLRQETLAAALEPVRKEQRRRLRAGVRGREAWAALETLEERNVLATGDDLAGVKIWMHALPAGERTLVCVFREGMWITSDAPYLEHSQFAGLAPFCAVVNVDDPTPQGDEDSVCALVREAEGETHSQIRPSEITNPQKKQRLQDALKRIAEVLHENGKPSTGQVVEPAQLRIFHGKVLTPAPTPPPRRRMEPPPVDEDREQEVEDIEDGGENAGGEVGDENGGSGGGGGSGGQSDGSDAAPRRASTRGKTSGIRVASRHLGDKRWSVAWRVDKIRPSGLSVMAVLPSGTDETTERQPDDTALQIASVSVNDAIHSPPNGGDQHEIRLGQVAQSGEAVVELSESLAPTDAATVKIRVLHARGESPT